MRKRSEDKLRLQSSALESAANAIVITDPRGSIQWVNPAFTELTGYSFEESVGHNPRILKSGKHEESFYQNLWKTIMAGEIWAGQIENRKKDGQLYTEEMTIAPVRSKTGGIANFIAIKQDVTERKRVEAELVSAKESAEVANRAKSEFLANMSHEVRTPMNGIIGMTDFALDTELTPQQRDYLETVKGSAHSLLTVINDVLDFSKIEAGKLDLETIEFSPRDCVGTSVEMLAMSARGKGLDLFCRIHADVPDILLGDPGRL